MGRIWLPEPKIEDNTWGKRGEQPLEWLERSTLPRAKACRQFLNFNLSQLPEQNQEDFYNALHHRYKSSFFELIVARTLQILGAEIKIEVEQENRKNPDFLAQFAKQTIIVEAISPSFNPEAGNEMRERSPLYEIVETFVPEGWTVGIWELPQIGFADSKKEFKHVLSEMLDIKPPSNEFEELDLIEEISTGTISLHLVAKRSDYPAIIWEAPITTFVDTEDRIYRAIRKKRKQVRNTDLPAFVAIEGSWFSYSLEDYDMAIYGHSCAVMNHLREWQEPKFIADGLFTTNRDEPPTFAGAIIFPEVGVKSVRTPVLYNHPRFEGDLPQELSILEQRIYKHGYGIDSIQSIPTKNTNLLEGLGFINV